MDVLITGANGPVGTAIVEHLVEDDRYEFTCLDLDDHPDSRVRSVVADVTDYEAIRPHFDGVDAVIDLARASFPDGEQAGEGTTSWSDALAANLEGTTNVYAAAADAGAETVVYASSNHAVGMYEVENAPEIYYPEFDLLVDETVQPRPDSMYGVWKVYGEALGRMCAETNDLRCYALRICNVTGPDRETPRDYAESLIDGGMDPDDEEFRHKVQRKRAMWHSRRDLAHLVDRCLRDDTVEFGVLYGVSDNRSRWFDIENARELLGYDPQDDGDEWEIPGER